MIPNQKEYPNLTVDTNHFEIIPGRELTPNCIEKTYRIAGVTFESEYRSRQEILREMYYLDGTFESNIVKITLKPDTFENESALRILANAETIGFFHRESLPEVIGFYNKIVAIGKIEVFKASNNYPNTAKITLVINPAATNNSPVYNPISNRLTIFTDWFKALLKQQPNPITFMLGKSKSFEAQEAIESLEYGESLSQSLFDADYLYDYGVKLGRLPKKIIEIANEHPYCSFFVKQVHEMPDGIYQPEIIMFNEPPWSYAREKAVINDLEKTKPRCAIW